MVILVSRSSSLALGLDTQQNWCTSDKFIIYWHVDGVTFPIGKVVLVFVRGRGPRVLD